MHKSTRDVTDLRGICSQLIERIKSDEHPHLMDVAEQEERARVAEMLQRQYERIPVQKLIDGVIGQHLAHNNVSPPILARCVCTRIQTTSGSELDALLCLLPKPGPDDSETQYLVLAATLFFAVRKQDADLIRQTILDLEAYCSAPLATAEGIAFSARYLPAAADIIGDKRNYNTLFELFLDRLEQVNPYVVPLWVVTLTNHAEIWNDIQRRLKTLSSKMTTVDRARSPRSSTELALILTNASLESGRCMDAVDCSIQSLVTWFAVGSLGRMYHRPALIAALPMLVAGRCDRALINASLSMCQDDVSFRYCCYELLSPAIISGDRGVVEDLLYRHASAPARVQHQVANDRPVFHLIKDLEPSNIDPNLAEMGIRDRVVSEEYITTYETELAASHLAGLGFIAGRGDIAIRHGSIPSLLHDNVHSAWFHAGRRTLAIRSGMPTKTNVRAALVDQVRHAVTGLIDELVASIRSNQVDENRVRTRVLLRHLQEEKRETTKQYRAASKELAELRETLRQDVEERTEAAQILDDWRKWLMNDLSRELQSWRHTVDGQDRFPLETPGQPELRERALYQIATLNSRLRLSE